MQFPTILVINLAHRTDRWEAIQKDFAEKGWPLLHRIDAIKAIDPDPGWHACKHSHIGCINLAKENNLPWVLILEDDCLPTDDALQRFQDLLPYLWEIRDNWDIFMGGTLHIKVNSVIQQSPPIINYKGLTTHFCLIHQSSYDKIISSLESYPLPIDVIYRINESFTILGTVPHLAIQYNSDSNITTQYGNYDGYFETSNKILTEFLLKESQELCK